MSVATTDDKGHRAEALAAWWLRLQGFRVVATRYRTPVGEIDLVVARGRLVAFVEVKQRPTMARALEAVQPHQQRRIARAASHFLARRQAAPDAVYRFDVVVLAPWRLPRHVPDAFRADTL